LRPPSRLTRGLNSRQQQANENGNDGNHHKQLDQGKTAVSSSHGLWPQENEKENRKPSTWEASRRKATAELSGVRF
jgi:hypothetical protein